MVRGIADAPSKLISLIAFIVSCKVSTLMNHRTGTGEILKPFGDQFKWAVVPVIALTATWLASGCYRPPGGPEGGQAGQAPSELRANALAVFKEEKPSVSSYRSAVQQLNHYLDISQEVRDRLVLDPKVEQLVQQPGFLDTPDRIAEIKKKSFTLLDSHHLDARFLFRDAARALTNDFGNPPRGDAEALAEYQLNLARYAFDWVMRHVYLEPRPRRRDDPRTAEIIQRFRQMQLPPQTPIFGVPWPAHEVLRRGTGDAEDRARVYLALLEQLGLEGGIITRSIQVRDDGRIESRERPWAVGVVIGTDIYLFDPLLGRPIAGPEPGSVATLRRIQHDPAILRAWYQPILDDAELRDRYRQAQRHPSDPVQVTPAMLATPSLLLYVEMTSLAPRMRELQEWLLDAGDPVKLYSDVASRIEKLRQAGLGVPIRLWGARSAPGYPAALLPQYFDDRLNEIRRVAILAPRAGRIPPWIDELAAELRAPAQVARLYQRYESYVLSVRTGSGRPRDLLVRGRPEVAVDIIIDTENIIDRMIDMAKERHLTSADPLRKTWVPKLIAAVREFQERNLELQKAAPGSAEAIELEERLRVQSLVVEGLWREPDITWRYLSMQWAEPLMRENLTYYMALAKVDLAIRAELQSQQGGPAAPGGVVLTPAQRWASADRWLRRYLDLIVSQPNGTWTGAVGELLKRCRAAQDRLAQSATSRPTPGR